MFQKDKLLLSCFIVLLQIKVFTEFTCIVSNEAKHWLANDGEIYKFCVTSLDVSLKIQELKFLQTMQIVHNRLRANANSQQSKKYRGITTAKCITTITDKQYMNKSDLLLACTCVKVDELRKFSSTSFRTIKNCSK